MVDGEVVADEPEVGELDLLLPQQALAPGDLPHLSQDLEENFKITIFTNYMNIDNFNKDKSVTYCW